MQEKQLSSSLFLYYSRGSPFLEWESKLIMSWSEVLGVYEWEYSEMWSIDLLLFGKKINFISWAYFSK